MSTNENNSNSVITRLWDCTICRIGILIVASFLSMLLLASIFSNQLFNWIIKPQIVNSINNETTNIKIGSIDYSFFQNKLIGFDSELVLKNCCTKSCDTTSIKIPVIAINNFNFISFLFGYGYSISSIYTENVNVTINEYSRTIVNQENETKNLSESTILQMLAKSLPDYIKPLSVNHLQINSASIVRNTYSDETTIDTIKQVSISISDINIRKKSITKGKDNSIGEIKIRLKDIHRKMLGTGYDFKISTISYFSSINRLKIKDLELKPFISDVEFFKRRKYRSDRWIIKIPEIKNVGINLISLLEKNLLAVDSLIVSDFNIAIVTNKTLPADPKSDPKMPHELITTLGFNLELKKIIIKNSSFLIQSIMPNVNRRAQLTFNNINAVINNISNTKNKQTVKNPCTINASGYLQETGKLKVELSYPLLTKDLTFNYEGSMDKMDAVKLNSHLEVEDKAHIKSGKIIKATFSVDVNKSVAAVNIIPLYENLSIKILTEDAESESILPSFFAKFKIRKSNPDDNGKIKSANITYIKKPTDAFLDVVWLSILKGLGDVVGF